jgi:hypothetical protein
MGFCGLDGVVLGVWDGEGGETEGGGAICGEEGQGIGNGGILMRPHILLGLARVSSTW